MDEILLELAEQLDNAEGYRRPHAFRVARLADLTAQKFHLAQQDRVVLRHAALVHDIGIGLMNRGYMRQSGRLTADERQDLARHTVLGEQEAAKRKLSRSIQLLVRWHHEWWNGEGYPDGLRGEQIPLGARILRVCDTFAALTDERPHCPPVTSAEARLYLTQWAGIEFDPRVVKVFLELEDAEELRSVADKAPVVFEGENLRAELVSKI